MPDRKYIWFTLCSVIKIPAASAFCYDDENADHANKWSSGAPFTSSKIETYIFKITLRSPRGQWVKTNEITVEFYPILTRDHSTNALWVHNRNLAKILFALSMNLAHVMACAKLWLGSVFYVYFIKMQIMSSSNTLGCVSQGFEWSADFYSSILIYWGYLRLKKRTTYKNNKFSHPRQWNHFSTVISFNLYKWHRAGHLSKWCKLFRNYHGIWWISILLP